MPKVDRSITKDGLVCDVMIGTDGQLTIDLKAANMSIPRPILATALIDTGSDITVIDGSIVRALGLVPKLTAQSQTTIGLAKIDLYSVSLRILTQQYIDVLVIPTLTVMKLTHPLPKIDALLGMDVLADCQLLVDGPAQQFSLSA